MKTINTKYINLKVKMNLSSNDIEKGLSLSVLVPHSIVVINPKVVEESIVISDDDVIIINNTINDTIIGFGTGVTNEIVIEEVIEKHVKICSYICILILLFPIPFCDLYYAAKYNVCLSQTNYNMEISMYEYLLVNCVYNFINMFLLICTFYCINLQTTQLQNNCILKLIGRINMAFNFVWTLCGSIIFWVYLNQRECSQYVDNYLRITLMIKIIFVIIQSILNFNNN